MDNLLGQWKYDFASSPGLIDFMASSGFPREVCTKEKTDQIKLSVTKEGNSYQYTMALPGIPANVITYTPGEPFVLKIPNGLSYKVHFSEEDGKVVQRMVHEPSGNESLTIFEPVENGLKQVYSASGKSLNMFLVKA